MFQYLKENYITENISKEANYRNYLCIKSILQLIKSYKLRVSARVQFDNVISTLIAPRQIMNVHLAFSKCKVNRFTIKCNVLLFYKKKIIYNI